MKILHITGNDSNGAGIAALRIVLAQRANGFDAQMIVRNKSSNYDFIHKYFFFKYVDFLFNSLLKLIGLNDIISLNAFKIINSHLFKQADIVHLHNIHHIRMLHPILLPKNKKYVYTLHDMWAITGNCNYNFDLCDKYKTGCGKCPLNNDGKDWGFPKMIIDQTRFQQKLKKQAYENRELIFVSPSRWLMQKSQESLATLNKKTICIPNAIEPEHGNFRKNRNKKLKLLFVGQKSRSNDRKGFAHIEFAANTLDVEFELHIAGKMSEDFDKNITNDNCKLIFHGPVSLEKMNMLYREVDILLLPTKQDNFPNTILESFTQGTPVVSFNVGGVPEVVNNNTGYLAMAEDSKDFTEGIKYVWKNFESLSQNVLNAACNYDFNHNFKSYSNLYRLLLAGKN